ncbi:MAG: hypothetical protein WD749_08305 [Phycisphaerales bacterium]
MDDRELLQLVRMALEAEDLGAEGAGAPPRLRLAGAGAHPAHIRAFRFAGGLIAAAAALALAVVIMAPTPAPPPAPLVSNDSHRQPPAPPPEIVTPPSDTATAQAAATGGFVFVVYRAADGTCDCKELKRPQWSGGKRLAEIGRQELLDAVLGSRCTSSAERMVVLAVEGPADMLPGATAAAERVASRLASAPPLWNEDISSIASAAMPDLPQGSTVVAKSVAMR